MTLCDPFPRARHTHVRYMLQLGDEMGDRMSKAFV